MSLEREWIKKMWYIYKMEYYSSIKRNKITAFAATWMDLENTKLSEVSETETPTSYSITYICNPKKKKKGHNELLCRTDTDSQTLKNLQFLKETDGGVGMEML